MDVLDMVYLDNNILKNRVLMDLFRNQLQLKRLVQSFEK